MLLTKSIKVEINKGNLGYYNKKLNKKFKIGDIIDVDINNFPKSSLTYVDVKCDICGTQNKTKFRNYNECLSYGFYSCQKCKHIKRKETCRKKYNDENFNNLNKRYTTMNEKYGEYYNNRDKSRETCKEKYGVNNVSNIELVKIKKKETTLKNWGVENPTYIMDNKFIYSIDNYISYDNENKLHEIYCKSGHNYKIDTNLFYSRYYRSVDICTICNKINDNSSSVENSIVDFIRSNYEGEVIQSYRDGLEIDIYLPELKIGFEFNGLYWHSSKFKDKNYHLNKTKFFKERGIQLLHIWEDEWYLKSEILKSIILNKLGKSEKVYARKTEVRLIDDIKIVKDFLNKNHIQGYNNNIKVSLGLYRNDKLLSLMCFNDLEGRKRMYNGFNITRFCNVLNTTVIGGSSKLLSYFIKNFNTKYIISYADRSMSNGNLYKKMGFEEISSSYPDYKYVVNGKRLHKSNFKKEKLGIKGESITEKEYMLDQGIYQIYDCGKIKYKLELK